MEKWYSTMQKNFKQAFNEVFSLQGNKTDKNNKKNNGNNQSNGFKTEKEGLREEINLVEKTNQRDKGKESAKKGVGKAIMHQKEDYNLVNIVDSEKDKTSLISKSTIIQGNITTNSDLIIEGEVEGNIESKNCVVITGKQSGDIKCKNAEIKKAHINGNISVLDFINIEEGSTIVGDLSATSCKVDGRIEGNVDVKSDINIFKDAFIKGNVSASSISVENGAIIQGYINVKCENKQEDNKNVV
ncbi:MAG: bactofilin family protein [Bacillota bacterium]|jgi:cytoskeletal protein CcmA (bactofilin family)|nr:polymer-forming cytoskeletal protein [Clostridia bacterium]